MAIGITSSDDLRIDLLNKHFKVYAGPGAGKTHLLIENIKHIVSRTSLLNKDRKILCITYTNVAVNEIVSRLNDYTQYAMTKTIHSFLYQCVIKNYEKQLKVIIEEEFGIKVPKQLKFRTRIEGESLLSTVKKADIVEFLSNSNRFPDEKVLSIKKNEMANIIIDIKDNNLYPFVDNKVATIGSKVNISNELKMLIKEFIWTKKGLLDFDEILYFAYKLLKKFKHIVYYLRYSFPFVFIDEYQDTNPIQNEIIKMFADHKQVVLGLIGDSAQSIYGFNNADYRTFTEFKTVSKEMLEYRIEGNRRSNKNIVHFLNFLRTNDHNLSTQEAISDIENKRVKVIFTEKPANQLSHLVNSDYIVLCRRFIEALALLKDVDRNQKYWISKLNSLNVYGRGRNLVTDFKKSEFDWINIMKYIVEMKKASNTKNLARAIELSKDYIDLNFFEDSRLLEKYFLKDFIYFFKFFGSIEEDKNLVDIISCMNEILFEKDLVSLKPLQFEDDDIFQIVKNFNLHTLRIIIDNLYNDESIYSTIHRAKGKEFQKVFVETTPTGYESKIVKLSSIFEDLDIYSDNNSLGEYLRIIYVACSRAIEDLTVIFHGDINDYRVFISRINIFKEEHRIEEDFCSIEFH